MNRMKNNAKVKLKTYILYIWERVKIKNKNQLQNNNFEYKNSQNYIARLSQNKWKWINEWNYE